MPVVIVNTPTIVINHATRSADFIRNRKAARHADCIKKSKAKLSLRFGSNRLRLSHLLVVGIIVAMSLLRSNVYEVFF